MTAKVSCERGAYPRGADQPARDRLPRQIKIRPLFHHLIPVNLSWRNWDSWTAQSYLCLYTGGRRINLPRQAVHLGVVYEAAGVKQEVFSVTLAFFNRISSLAQKKLRYHRQELAEYSTELMWIRCGFIFSHSVIDSPRADILFIQLLICILNYWRKIISDQININSPWNIHD